MVTKKIKIFTVLLFSGVILFLSDVGASFARTEPPLGWTGTCQDVIVLDAVEKPTTTSTGFELKYPSIEGVVPVAEGEDVLPKFIKYIFYFAIAISGFIAFAALVYGGIKYLLSAGNASAMDEGKRQVIAGSLGIILLLGSVLLLNTINPQIVRLELKKVEPEPIEKKIGSTAGVYLLQGPNDTEDVDVGNKTLTIRKNVGTIGSVPALSAYEFDNKTEDLCVNPDFRENLLFHAVLHTEDNYEGECRIFYDVWHTGGLDSGGVGAPAAALDHRVSSVGVFTSKAFGEKPGEDFSADFAVRLYKNAQFFDDPDEPNDVCELSANEISPEIKIGDVCPGWEKEDISSLEVGYGWVLATFEKDDGSGRCEIFGSGQVPELKTHYIGRCIPAIKTGPFEGLWKPCVSSIAVFKGRIQ